MSNTSVKIFIFLSLCFFQTTSFSQHSIDIRDTLSQFLVDNGYPGAMISIVKSDSIVFNEGIGTSDLQTKEGVNAKQLFRQGSISKTFTALALFKLLTENQLSLDTPIRAIDPSIPFKNKWNDETPITVANVLEHSAGFDDFHTHAMYASEIAQPPMSKYVKAHRNSLYARWKPSTRHAYSNSGYVVAGHLIEVLAKQNYSTYIKENILEPLNMHASGFYYNKPNLPFVQGYDEQLNPAPFVNIKGGPAGDFCSNAEEMTNFLQFLLNRDGQLIDDTIFNDAAFDRIENASTTIASKNGLLGGYGLGNFSVYQKGYTFHGHNGAIEGFSSRYIYSREANIGISVAVNKLKDPTPIVKLILDLFVTQKSNKQRVTQPIPEELIEEYSGFYVMKNPRQKIQAWLNGFSKSFIVDLRKDKGYVKDILGGVRDSIFYAGDNLFYSNSLNEPNVVFMLSANGSKKAIGRKRDYAEMESYGLNVVYYFLSLLSILALFVYLAYFGIWFISQLLRRRKIELLERGLLFLGCICFPLWFLSMGFVLNDRETSGEMHFWSVLSYLTPLLMIFLFITVLFKIISLKGKNAFKVYYWFTTSCLFFVIMFLWNSGLIGLKLWSY